MVLSPFTSANLEPIVSGLAAVSLVVVAGLCIGGAILTIVLKDRRRRYNYDTDIVILHVQAIFEAQQLPLLLI